MGMGQKLMAPVILAAVGFGQSTGNAIVGAGYVSDIPLKAAPGQVLTIFVQGLVLPAELTPPNGKTGEAGGISVEFQNVSRDYPSVRLPILAARTLSTCPSVRADCSAYRAVTVQMPFDMAINVPGGTRPEITGTLYVSEKGVRGRAIQIDPVSDNIHLIAGCDIGEAPTARCDPAPRIMHSDGSLVTTLSPARSGEELIAYAVGLGAVTPVVQPGNVAPDNASTVKASINIALDFRPNSPPWNPLSAGLSGCSELYCIKEATRANLKSGSVGRYEVRFSLPSLPEHMAACARSMAHRSAGVSSNVTVTILGPISYDGAGICAIE